jgi:hypothetical protein
MVCLSEAGHKLPINVDFKEEGTRTLIGVFITAFVHYFLERFIFTVREVVLFHFNFTSLADGKLFTRP